MGDAKLPEHLIDRVAAILLPVLAQVPRLRAKHSPERMARRILAVLPIARPKRKAKMQGCEFAMEGGFCAAWATTHVRGRRYCFLHGRIMQKRKAVKRGK